MISVTRSHFHKSFMVQYFSFQATSNCRLSRRLYPPNILRRRLHDSDSRSSIGVKHDKQGEASDTRCVLRDRTQMRSGRLNEEDARSPLRLTLVMVALPFDVVVGREGWTEITEARRIVSHVFSGAPVRELWPHGRGRGKC